MKGNCDLVKCQICQQEMSFGRIKRHIFSRHKEITVEQYIKLYYQTLPLHKPCEVCKENIVYKYKTCSKECQSKLEHGLKGKSKPEGFMSEKHKDKISKSMKGSIGGFLGKTHSEKTRKILSENIKQNKPHLGYKHSEETKQKQRIKRKEYIKNNLELYFNNFIKNKPNKLEKFVSYILDKNNIKYNFQFFLNKNGICKSYDFKIQDTNILLEIDGNYWHGKNLKKPKNIENIKQNDLLKDQFAKDNGFILLRFWESEIYENPEIIICKINELK